jgi:hypothetical protein
MAQRIDPAKTSTRAKRDASLRTDIHRVFKANFGPAAESLQSRRFS